MLMDFEAACTATQGVLFCDFSPYKGFDSVSTDSRSMKERTLFIPLRGTQQDGHAYIEAALQLHAAAVFADSAYLADPAHQAQLYALCKRYGGACICVPDTLHALQHTAAAYLRRFPRLLKIGVTGSNGKTTTKELLGSLFAQTHRTITNQGNLNSETGLPLSLFNVRQEHEVGIFEIGMNRKHEIRELAGVLQPDIAVITNIGSAHIGILGSKDAIAAEKKQIFAFFTEKNVGFVPACDPYCAFLQDVPTGTIHTYGADGISYTDEGLAGTTLHYKNTAIHLAFPGKHNVHNALAAIAVAEHCCIPLAAIQKGLEQARPLFGRSQVIRGPAITYLLDCYNANWDSMQASIAFCDALTRQADGRKIYIIASMKELGSESLTIHRNLYLSLLESDADALFFFGTEICKAVHDIHSTQKEVESKVCFCFTETEAAALENTLDTFLKKGDFVLLKGSRALALEQFEHILKKER
ncbi:MAG: UDP-N-acetylmuramoyl-tripeptide--D-alanyl-D-alanine ligase [Treponema sp.]